MTITSGTPGFIGGKVDDISKVDEKTQSMYRSGVGTLLYLTKHSRPDIKRVIQEYGWYLHDTCHRDEQGDKFCS